MNYTIIPSGCRLRCQETSAMVCMGFRGVIKTTKRQKGGLPLCQ
jgi:hypothetical protein